MKLLEYKPSFTKALRELLEISVPVKNSKNRKKRNFKVSSVCSL
jgi:hypothetical protein